MCHPSLAGLVHLGLQLRFSFQCFGQPQRSFKGRILQAKSGVQSLGHSMISEQSCAKPHVSTEHILNHLPGGTCNGNSAICCTLKAEVPGACMALQTWQVAPSCEQVGGNGCRVLLEDRRRVAQAEAWRHAPQHRNENLVLCKVSDWPI